MRNKYRVRYKRSNGYFSFVETSGNDLTEEMAKIRTEEYLDANGIPYIDIVEAYLIEEEEE